MISVVKLFYLDTSFLMHIRHYLECQNVSQSFFPDGVKTGKKGLKALEFCEEKVDDVNVITSSLTSFEMNQRYRKWLAKKAFLQEGLPLETIDSGDRYLFSSLKSLPRAELDRLDDELLKSREWLNVWDYSDLVRVEPLNPIIFEEADPFQAWAPGITLLDSFHVAMALTSYAKFLVTDDGMLKKHVNNKIVPELKNNNALPSGNSFDLDFRAINSNEFQDIVKSL